MTEYKCGSAKQCQFGDMCKPEYDIGGCSHYKEKRPQTNEEWIKQCNTEQLAETIHKMLDGGLCDVCRYDCRERCVVHTKEDEIKVVVEWLKQPHTTIKE